MANTVYEPIRRKIEEWIYYDDHKPAGKYEEHQEEYDEYRRWHDRDCVLEGGNLNADTMFSLWLPLRHSIARLNDQETIQAVGNLYSKYDFLRALIQADHLEKLLPKSLPITAKLSTLFTLGMGRENIFILPARQLNSLRGKKPYWDYIPAFLQASFPGGEFASYWNSPREHLQWIEREHLQVFFDGAIAPENIKDLSGSGDIGNSLPPEGIQPMEDMIAHYIRILQERRTHFTEEELKRGAERDERMREDIRIQRFRDSAAKGDLEVLSQIRDVMNVSSMVFEDDSSVI